MLSHTESTASVECLPFNFLRVLAKQ
jgi:hypothetical protein